MKLTKSKLREIIREELLTEVIYTAGAVNHHEANLFDSIEEFKRVFDSSAVKKNKKINSIIKQLLKLESQLSKITKELE